MAQSMIASPLNDFSCFLALNRPEATGSGPWQTTDNDQAKFQTKALESAEQVKRLIDCAEVFADAGVGDQMVALINKRLQSEDFDVRLDPVGDDGVASVSVLTIHGHFKTAAVRAQLKSEATGRSYAAGTMFEASHNYSVWQIQVSSSVELVLQVHAEDGQRSLFLCMPSNGAPPNQESMIHEIDSRRALLRTAEPVSMSETTFPLVKLDSIDKLSFLHGMEKGDFVLTQSPGQMQLYLRRGGYSVRVARAMGAPRCLNFDQLTFNQPFYVWLETIENDMSPVYAFCAEDCWLEADPD